MLVVQGQRQQGDNIGNQVFTYWLQGDVASAAKLLKDWEIPLSAYPTYQKYNEVVHVREALQSLIAGSPAEARQSLALHREEPLSGSLLNKLVSIEKKYQLFWVQEIAKTWFAEQKNNQVFSKDQLPKPLQHLYTLAEDIRPDQFLATCYHDAEQLRQNGQVDLAALIFVAIKNFNSPLANHEIKVVQEKAMAKLNYLQGDFNLGMATFDFTHTAVPQILNPEMIFGFTVANMAKRWARFKVFSNVFTKMEPANLGLIQNMGLRAGVGFSGLVAEWGAFSASGLGFQMMHQGMDSSKQVAHVLGSNAIVIAFLNLTQSLGAKFAMQNLFLRSVLQHSLGVSGFMLAHETEYALGLMDRQLSWQENLFQSVVTQGQSSLGGQVSHLLTGQKWLLSYPEINVSQFLKNISSNNYWKRFGEPWNPNDDFVLAGMPGVLPNYVMMGEDDVVNAVTIMPTQGSRGDARPTLVISVGTQSQLLAQNFGKEVYTSDFLTLKVGDYLPGSQRFKVLAKLGEGGFGVAIRVRDEELQRDDVIKIPKQNWIDDIWKRKFENETRIAANLPAGVAPAVYDQFEIVFGLKIPRMEFLEGHSLTRYLGMMDAQQVSATLLDRLVLFKQIAEQLAAAHRKKVAHFDIKPDNIMIIPGEKPRIMDWGLARISGNGKEIKADGGSGSPGYMAPEIFATSDEIVLANYRVADVYAMGTLLYELMSGKHPYYDLRAGDVAQGENTFVEVNAPAEREVFPVIVRQMNFTPPPLERVMDGSYSDQFLGIIRNIDAIARKAFSINPMERPQSLEEMLTPIDALIKAITEMAVQRSESYAPQQVFEHFKAKGLDFKEKYLRLSREAEQINLHIQMQYFMQSTQRKALPDQMFDWTQKYMNLRSERARVIDKAIDNLETALNYHPDEETKQLLAELVWVKLVENYDHLTQEDRDHYRQMIQTYDTSNVLQAALDDNFNLVPVEITFVNAGTKTARISVESYHQDNEGNYQADAGARQWFSYQAGDPLQIPLNPGYYRIGFNIPGMQNYFMPLHVTYDHALAYLQTQEKLSVQALQVPLLAELGKRVKNRFYLVPGGEYYVGVDHAREDPNQFLRARPLARVPFKTFAVSNPVTIGEYKAFLEDLIATNHASEARKYLPRYEEASKEDGREWKLITLEQSMTSYLYVPKLDKFGDPVTDDQPIHSIDQISAKAYVVWLSKKEGMPFRMPRVEEYEVLARGGFAWSFPWGYHFNDIYPTSLNCFRPINANHVMPVGVHPILGHDGRDRSLFGPVDTIGNTREIAGDGPTDTTHYIIGGSGRTPHSPWFWVAARNYTGNDHAREMNGSFRLVIDLDAGE